MFFNRNIKYFIMKINVDFIWPIGSYYETSNSSFNPNTSWGGTWVLETDGVALVSKSTTSGSIFNTTIGSIVGEEKHKLIIAEMPNHSHSLYTYAQGDWNSIGGNSTKGCGNTSDWVTGAMAGTGGDQAHNNVQPSKIVNRWHRTA